MMKNISEILKTMPLNITTNELQLEAVWGSVTILKRALTTKLLKSEIFTPWSMNRDPLLK